MRPSMSVKELRQLTSAGVSVERIREIQRERAEGYPDKLALTDRDLVFLRSFGVRMDRLKRVLGQSGETNRPGKGKTVEQSKLLQAKKSYCKAHSGICRASSAEVSA